ncbi:MAG: hypothetical protein QOE09_3538 [Ilumatobacteraceae bacterium]
MTYSGLDPDRSRTEVSSRAVELNDRNVPTSPHRLRHQSESYAETDGEDPDYGKYPVVARLHHRLGSEQSERAAECEPDDYEGSDGEEESRHPMTLKP